MYKMEQLPEFCKVNAVFFPSTTYNGRLPFMVEYLTEASGLSNLIKGAS